MLMAMLLCSGCKYTKDGDADYKPQDEYVLPTSGDHEKGSVPYVVGKLVEMGQVVRDYNELQADPIGAVEAYSIRTNGVTVEFYRFEQGAALFEKIKELGAYPIMDDQGNVLATRRAVINGNIVMMIPAEQNKNLEDISALNNKLVDRFLSLSME